MNRLSSSPSVKFAPVLLCLVLSALVVGSVLAGPASPAGGQPGAGRDPQRLPTRATLAINTNNLNANATRIAGTATALAGRMVRTATVLSGRAGGTATALARRLQLTATMLYSGALKTATALSSRFAPTLTALAFSADITRTIPADEAAAALTSYASQVLGTAVTVTKAGGITAAVTANLAQTDSSAAAQSSAVKLATTSYGGLLSNGAATLSYGSGTVSGDIDLDVQAQSLGVYSLVVATKAKLTADSALALAQATFPGLAGFDYVAYQVDAGYAWEATGYVPAIDPKTHQVVVTAEVVILYVLPGSGGKAATVTATVGRGDYATTIPLSVE